jgi:hypothetical protein
MNLEQPDMHPSNFQVINKDADILIRRDRTLSELQRAPLIGPSVSELVSPGSHNFTVNDNQLSEYNQRQLFKNLHGDTLLTDLFFSAQNIRNIQNVLRMLVFRQMGYVIDTQSINDLLIIMRSIFLEYSEHPVEITNNMSIEEQQKLGQEYTEECDRLNQLVINETLPKLCSALQQYLDYLHDASTPIRPMAPPINDSIAGTRELRSITQVLAGTQL